MEINQKYNELKILSEFNDSLKQLKFLNQALFVTQNLKTFVLNMIDVQNFDKNQSNFRLDIDLKFRRIL